MNMLIASTAMVTRVDAAFLLSGGRKAGTPFDTASTPVIAVHPFENAVRMANVASASTWLAGSTDGSGTAWRSPDRNRQLPTPSITKMLTTKK